MSDGLASLIRLHRWQLDEEKRRLAQMLCAWDEARDELSRLDAETERERHSAADDAVGFAYAAYAGRAIARRAAAVEACDRTEAAATAQRQAVLHCHRQMRSTELAEQARRDKLARESRRNEQIAIDELALLTRSYTEKR